MEKIAFTIELQESKIRKRHAPPGRAHSDGKKYRRKRKHKENAALPEQGTPAETAGVPCIFRAFSQRKFLSHRSAGSHVQSEKRKHSPELSRPLLNYHEKSEDAFPEGAPRCFFLQKSDK
jgi:hypothetical protein